MDETETVKSPSIRSKEPSVKSQTFSGNIEVVKVSPFRTPSVQGSTAPSPIPLLSPIKSPPRQKWSPTGSPTQQQLSPTVSPTQQLSPTVSPTQQQLSPRVSPSPQQPSPRVSPSPQQSSPKASSSPQQPSPRASLSPQQPSPRASPSPQQPSLKASLSPPQPSPRASRSPPQPPLRSSSFQSAQSRQNSLRSEKSIRSASSKLQQQRSISIKSNVIEEETKSGNIGENVGQYLEDHLDKLTDTIRNLSKDLENPQSPPKMDGNIDKIADMSKKLTKEANALRESIKHLSMDIAKTKNEFCVCSNSNEVETDFPYHLFLIEIVVNKIHMKCECFDIDYNNLVIAATFLDKHPIVLYDPSYGKIENFNRLNVGKSTLFAMTYDKICAIQEFMIVLQLTKQPPCSNCVTKLGETRMDYTKEFIALREDLCSKWCQQQPTDDIHCTSSTPLSKNMYYLSVGDEDCQESIGVIEVTVRMSFLGKEITTAFASPKPQAAKFLLKEDNGMSMYSCHKVEMDDHGKILLDEDVISKRTSPRSVSNRYGNKSYGPRSESPVSQLSSFSTHSSEKAPAVYSKFTDGVPKYDEIFTKMNENELKIRVPKSTKVERMGKYDKIQELCSCESTPYNTGEQIQFELPRDRDLANPNKTHTSNLTYTYRGEENRRNNDNKDRKIVNVTPTNCPVPVDMQKIIHPQKDVFILKIGKKLETKDKKTDLEIELVTPKAPPEKTIENTHIAQQYSSGDLDKAQTNKKKAKKGGKKGSKKGAKKGKGAKSARKPGKIGGKKKKK